MASIIGLSALVACDNPKIIETPNRNYLFQDVKYGPDLDEINRINEYVANHPNLTAESLGQINY